jgi:ABC-2 type transport system permease protein
LTLFFMMFGIVGLAVGIGAIYPRFKLENPARLAIGLSGTLFLVVGMFFVVGVLLLEIWPVYTILAAEYRNQSLSLFQWGGIILSFCGAALFIGVALFLPMRLGLKNLTEMDF